MSALLIGQAERDKIEALKALAADPLDATEMIQLAKSDPLAFTKMMMGFTIELPSGFMVTYSLEKQPIGLVRHISVSVRRPGMMPHPAAVSMILEAFDMRPIEKSDRIWIEEVDADTKAVNLLQFV